MKSFLVKLPSNVITKNRVINRVITVKNQFRQIQKVICQSNQNNEHKSINKK